MNAEIEQPARPRILVVDDDIAIGRTIKRYLHQYEVAIVDCVQDTLEQLATSAYDLVLLDRRLPDGLGDVVVEEVHNKRLGVPIIMMSGEIDQSLFDHAAQFRPDDFIEKPFVREALLVKIERLLSAHAMREQTRRQQAELAELHERREREVDAARTILNRILARGQFDRDTIRHLVLPADRLAGDVVFGAWTGDGRYRWMIGDVTGHTLSSALVTVPLAGIFYRATQAGSSVAATLAAMEQELVAILPANMFCAGAICELDRRAGTLQVWSGGNPDILIRRACGALTRVAATSIPLAADRFSPPSHSIVEHAVAPGDRIFAFSDGLIEIRDELQRQIGFDRLLDIARSGEADTVFPRLLACIPDATGKLGYDDDISLVEVVV